MLRISETSTSTDSVILLLEGQVTSHCGEIVRETVEKILAKDDQLMLDLSGVSFADRSGIALLQDLQKRQVRLINGSPFLKEQLKQTRAV